MLSEVCLRYFSVLMLGLSGWLYIACGQTVERILFIVSVLFFLLSIKKIRIKCKVDTLDILYSIFIMSFFFDFFISFNPICILYGFSMMFLFLMCRSDFIAKNKKKVIRLLYFSALLCGYIIFIMTLLKTGISTANYKGILGNPNSMGHFAGFLFTFALFHILNSKENKIIDLVTIAIGAIFVVVSSSRTAFLCCSIEVLIPIYVIFKWKERNKKERFWFIVLVIFLILIIYFANLQNILYDSLFKKHVYYATQHDITNGRISMWFIAWKNSSWLGNGQLVFTDQAVHNVYFGLINQFGKLNGITFLNFIIVALLKTVHVFFKKKSDSYICFTLMCLSYFFIVSLMENYLMTAPMVLSFFGLNAISNDYDKQSPYSKMKLKNEKR